MTKIVGIGNALVDVLVRLDSDSVLRELRLPRGGMTHIDAEQHAAISRAMESLHAGRATGGSASNTIHALAMMGDSVGFVGTVGDDAMGRFFATEAAAHGVDARLRVVADKPTGVANTFILPDGERTFATHLGAAPQIDTALLPTADDGYGVLHVEGYLVQDHALVENIMSRAHYGGLLVSYDLASWNIVEADHAFVRHLISEYVDIAFANEEEAAAFSRQDDPETALRMLGELTQVAVVKVGKRGAWGMAEGRTCLAAKGPSEQVHAVDTTAAGDFFAAGFLHAYTRGGSLEACLRAGNLSAGEVVQVMGTQVDAASFAARMRNI